MEGKVHAGFHRAFSLPGVPKMLNVPSGPERIRQATTVRASSEWELAVLARLV
jgi:hypothetical protein